MVHGECPEQAQGRKQASILQGHCPQAGGLLHFMTWLGNRGPLLGWMAVSSVSVALVAGYSSRSYHWWKSCKIPKR